MTKDEIEKLAQEAGLEMSHDTLSSYEGFERQFTKFAELVAAAERKKCIDIALELMDKQLSIGRRFACNEVAAAIIESGRK